ncbi:rhodanese-like domain-containing protein [Frisingicoccus sp.]|uniref:rhodanese-like domain-containing protein n=1 Tax=Frisingicoccus sp. TaxID=1918627 RepID=UPI002A8248BF|nr:rhodanese-like domain-containing protein [Frisingicoccus sp.]MDY4922127.1 rhodanese-like domain-containing protein [Frisingicoccus sp.]
MSLELVSTGEVLKYMREGDAIIIDIRDEAAFLKKHIPGAILMPYAVFDENAPILKTYGNIILCCERGATSLLLGRKLSKKGYKILSLGGGMEAWRGPLILE